MDIRDKAMEFASNHRAGARLMTPAPDPVQQEACVPPTADPPDTHEGGLNPAQARAVRATFTQVSELLDEVLRLGNGQLTPFDRQLADISSFETRRMAALVDEIRGRLLTALDDLGIPRPEPEGSARWSASTAFLYAEIALSELSPHTLRGYGTLDDSAAGRLEAVAAELKALAHRGQTLLRDGG